jgi:hypothetical protein
MQIAPTPKASVASDNTYVQSIPAMGERVGSVPAPLLIWIKSTALRSQMTPVCLGVRPLSTARDFSQIVPYGAACRPTEAGRNLLQSLIGNGHDENALNPVPDHAVHCRANVAAERAERDLVATFYQRRTERRDNRWR